MTESGDRRQEETPTGAARADRGRRVAWAILGSVLLIALALRMWGLTFGLPAVYNPDEVAIMSRALAFAKGDLNPHNFLYPTLYFYVLFGWVGGYFAAGRVLGLFTSASAFQQQFFVDPTGVFLAGRFLSVLCGVAGVWVTYHLARRVYGRFAGLAAAAFLAAAPFHVRDAHYVKHDVAAALAISAAILAILWFAEAPAGERYRWRRLAWASALCGVAFSTHYYAVFLAAPLALAVCTARDTPLRLRARDLLVASGIAAAVFFACSPFILADPRAALNDIVANRRIVVDRALQTPAGGGLFPYVGTYATMLWKDAIGAGVVVLAVAGIMMSLASTWRRSAILLAFPLAYFAFITNTVPATRYLTPILPVIAVFAGAGTTIPLARLRRRGGLVCTAIVVVVAAPSVVDSVRQGLFFSQADTRTVAQRFIETSVPTGASVAIQPYSVPLTQSRASLVESLSANLGDVSRASTKFTMRLALEPYPEPAYRLIYLGDGGLDADKIYVGYQPFAETRSLAPLTDKGVEYVVFKRPHAREVATVALADALARDADRLAVFSPFERPDTCGAGCPEPFLHNADASIDTRLARPGPVIEVWRIRPAAEGVRRVAWPF